MSKAKNHTHKPSRSLGGGRRRNETEVGLRRETNEERKERGGPKERD